MHRQLLNQAQIELTIEPTGPILIKASDTGADPTRPDMEFVRTLQNGVQVPYLPGPSLKGVIRSHCERIARSLGGEAFSCNPVAPDLSCVDKRELKQEHDGHHVHLRSCFLCQMFGNTVLAGRVRTADAYPVDPNAVRSEERNGVAIDRVFGSVAVGPFQMEVLTEGAFRTEIALHNFTIAQLGLLALALRDLKLGRVGIGFGKSRGLGRVTLSYDRVALQYTRRPRSERHLAGVANLLGADEARAYGYLTTSERREVGLGYAYASVDQDVAALPSEMSLADDGWGVWSLEMEDADRIESLWRACIPAWQAVTDLGAD
jgi:CRISPR-associated RAMP protein (TIGR02581 family)